MMHIENNVYMLNISLKSIRKNLSKSQKWFNVKTPRVQLEILILAAPSGTTELKERFHQDHLICLQTKTYAIIII